MIRNVISHGMFKSLKVILYLVDLSTIRILPIPKFQGILATKPVDSCGYWVDDVIFRRGYEPLDSLVEIGVERKDVEEGGQGGCQKPEYQNANLRHDSN